MSKAVKATPAARRERRARPAATRGELRAGSSGIREPMRAPFTLSVLLAVIMAAQAVLGLGFPQLYRDVGFVGETWFGNDLVTLAVALPTLIAALLLERRGLVLGRLLWLGALAYVPYNYGFYLFGAALNAFFPLYVAAIVVGASGFILTLSRTAVNEVAEGFGPRTPVRVIGGYFVFVAAGLTAIWLGMWAAYIFAGRPTPIEPEAFRLVAALDLTVMVPLLAAGGVLLWLRRPLGYVIAAVAAILGSLYLLVLTLNAALFIVRGLTEGAGELPVWGALAAGTTAAAVGLLMNARGRIRGV